MNYSRLVLFDIDGTLLYHAGAETRGIARFAHAMKVAFGISLDFDFRKYNGMIDRQMAWDIAKQEGVKREQFLEKFPAYAEAMLSYLQEGAKDAPLYQPIPDAVDFVGLLKKQRDIALGLITGNVKRIADWKLNHAGLAGIISFGLYGDEADDRNALAHLVFEKAEKEFHQIFSPAGIVVIGDTVHDIRCGRAIGAMTIAVTTGYHGDRGALQSEKPDLLVDSLLDKQVRDIFGV
ncbi:HAD family hydrolase [Candidatus Gottesmanbacteria bacterium]|nr:HAD family hydrolase [Candidatus Gottesmanbacteria bacterium]